MKVYTVQTALILSLVVGGCRVTPGLRWNSPLPERPVVLIVGDSISMSVRGYLGRLKELLKDRCEVVHNPGNGGHSVTVLAHLEEWVSAVGPDVIHFNCGLHDISLDQYTGSYATPPKVYERNLREIATYLTTKTRARLIFALTTPVDNRRHFVEKQYFRRDEDVRRYNEIAIAVMADYGILVNDLYSVVANAGAASCLKRDGIHMKDRGNALLASAVARAIGSILDGKRLIHP